MGSCSLCGTKWCTCGCLPHPPQGPYEGSQRRLCDIPASEWPQLAEWLREGLEALDPSPGAEGPEEGLECVSEETKEND